MPTLRIGLVTLILNTESYDSTTNTTAATNSYRGLQEETYIKGATCKHCPFTRS